MNSEIYNGPSSVYTQKAVEIETLAKAKLDQKKEPLFELEKNIRRTQAEAEKGEMETDEEHTEAAPSEVHELDESSMMAFDEATRDSMSILGGDDLDSSRALADELRLSDDEDEEDGLRHPTLQVKNMLNCRGRLNVRWRRTARRSGAQRRGRA